MSVRGFLRLAEDHGRSAEGGSTPGSARFPLPAPGLCPPLPSPGPRAGPGKTRGPLRGREPGARDLSWAPKPLRQGLGVLPVPCGPRVCGFTGHLAGPTAAPGRRLEETRQANEGSGLPGGRFPPHPWGPCDREFRRKRGDVISCFSAEPSRSQTLWEERRVHLGPRRPEEQATSASAPIKRGNFPLVSRKPCAGSEHTSIFCKITSPCEELHTARRCRNSLRTGVAWPGRRRVRRRFSLE